MVQPASEAYTNQHMGKYMRFSGCMCYVGVCVCAHCTYIRTTMYCKCVVYVQIHTLLLLAYPVFIIEISSSNKRQRTQYRFLSTFRTSTVCVFVCECKRREEHYAFGKTVYTLHHATHATQILVTCPSQLG